MSAHTSTASVPTDRAGRYAKQLSDHMGRKADAQWDAEAGTGTIVFADGAATARLTAAPTALDFALEAVDAEALARFEHVLGIHLIRFGRRDELVCSWVRTDGTPGTSQSVADLED